jgi:S-adenosyl-L-methionine hydrolase (adenosine-forming)
MAGPTISFLTDFGAGSERVGVCRAVMASLAPDARVVDITHDLPPFDIRAGALTLVRCAQYLPQGVVLAVVDPAAGTGRRYLAVQVEGGVFVGPDNGILAPAVAMVGGPTALVELTNDEYQLEPLGRAAATRDVLAPAAAFLANGVDIAELGNAVDPNSLVPGLLPICDVRDDGTVAGEVIGIDRYGNCQLNIDPETLEANGMAIGDGMALEVQVGEITRRARIVEAYAHARPAELVAMIDGSGLLTLACDRASAALELSARLGTATRVLGAGRAGTDPSTAGDVPVSFTRPSDTR